MKRVVHADLFDAIRMDGHLSYRLGYTCPLCMEYTERSIITSLSATDAFVTS